MLLYLFGLQLPPEAPAPLHERVRIATDQLWSCVLRGSSYEVFFAESAPLVHEILAQVAGAHTEDEVMAVVLTQQSDSLYANVATALRVLAGVFLRMHETHQVCGLLEWMGALSVAHPPFSDALLRSYSLICADDLVTPTQLLATLTECVRKAHILPPNVACDAARAHSNEPWDMGVTSRRELLVAVVHLLQALAWTLQPDGFRELQPFFQAPGIVLALLSSNSSAVLEGTVQLLTLIASDPLTLHMCLSSAHDTTLLPRPTTRLLGGRFPVVDMLAKHLVDRRGDTPEEDVHRLHGAVLQFLTDAVRRSDTSIVLVESVPLLPALIQTLCWDTSLLWNSEPTPASPGTALAEQALERVCQSVRLLHDLYLPEGHAARNLGERLLAPAAQAALNGVRHAFTVAVGRIAFASEPDWLVAPVASEVIEVRSRMRTQLEHAAGTSATARLTQCWQVI